MTTRFADGGFYALLGPSGSGKTTLLRMVAGFEHPDAGRISIAGRPVEDVPVEKREIGMVFQSYALFPNMSVFDNVAFGLAVRGAARARIRSRVGEALELVRLAGFDRRRPHQLSGGQKQRVALARALVTRPRVLLLDEPLSALDKALRVEMQVELKRIQRDVAITTLFVTHDQEEALTLSDRVGILNEGRLIQEGPPHEIYERPETAFAARFLGDANLLAGIARDGGIVLADGARLWSGRPSGPPTAARSRVRCARQKIRIETVARAVDAALPASEIAVGGYGHRRARGHGRGMRRGAAGAGAGAGPGQRGLRAGAAPRLRGQQPQLSGGPGGRATEGIRAEPHRRGDPRGDGGTPHLVAPRHGGGGAVTGKGLAFGPLDGESRHVCIDMQRLFLEPGPWFAEAGLAILPAVRRLIDHAPENAIFTRFVTADRAEDAKGSWQRYYRHWSAVTRSEAGSEVFDLHPDLAGRAAHGRIFDKTTHDAFHGADFAGISKALRRARSS